MLISDCVQCNNPISNFGRVIGGVCKASCAMNIRLIQWRRAYAHTDPGDTVTCGLNIKSGLGDRVVLPNEGKGIPADRMHQTIRSNWRHSHNIWSHHIHLFMRKDVTVVHIFPAEVDQAVHNWIGRDTIRIYRVEHRCIPQRHHRIHWTDRVRYFKGKDRYDWSDGKVRVLQWMYPHSILPTEFISFRRFDYIIPGHPVQ